MPDESRAITPAEPRDIATMPIGEAIEAYAPNFAAVLPPNIPLDHFKRMVMTAISVSPELIGADRRTFFNSCVKCASDGLLPDGREAALVIYKTKVKNRQGGETWIEAVQYLPMVAGIRKRLRNSGEVDSATAEVVYRKDRFKYRLGDDAFIEHVPPPLDEDRGDPIGAYAIIKLTSGEVIREVLPLAEIEKARAVSQAKDAAAGPWVKWWSEMARKTALRRAAKAAPQAAVLEKLLSRDDELPDAPPAALIEPPPPRPQRQDFVAHQPEAEPAPDPPFFFVDQDGAVHEYEHPGDAATDFFHFYELAGRARGEDGMNGLWESNGALLSALREAGRADLADGLSRDCGVLLDAARKPAAEPAPESRNAARTDAKPAPAPQTTARPASPRQPPRAAPAATEITGQSGVEAQDMGYLHPEMERQAALGLGVAEPADRPPTREIPMVLRNGKPDPKTWLVVFMPKLRQFKDRDEMAFFLGDNEAHIAACKAAGLEAAVLSAIDDQFRLIEGTPP